MKDTLPLYGVFSAIAAIIGLAVLANQLIFPEKPKGSGMTMVPEKSGQGLAMMVPGTGVGIKGASGTPPDPLEEASTKPGEKSGEKSPVSAQSDLERHKPETGAKGGDKGQVTAMIPGDARRNAQFRKYYEDIPPQKKLPLPVKKEAGGGQPVSGSPVQKMEPVREMTKKPAIRQSWISKLFYGDRAKMEAEKQARIKAVYRAEQERLEAVAAGLLEKAINGSHRKDHYRVRDKYRHPKQTLMFFGLRPEMTVIEMWPGEGWYSDIIAPVVKDRGQFYAASWDRQLGTRNIDAALKRYTSNYIDKPEIFGKVILTSLSQRRFEIGPDNSADLIFSSRNMYSWIQKKMERPVFAAMYRALKPGGVLGIVDHRETRGSYQDPRAQSGYVTERYVIHQAELAGLVFVGKSEINANPKDIRHYPRGVFSLPPVLKERKKNRKKYLAIGESDRMTLKFMKPKVSQRVMSSAGVNR